MAQRHSRQTLTIVAGWTARPCASGTPKHRPSLRSTGSAVNRARESEARRTNRRPGNQRRVCLTTGPPPSGSPSPPGTRLPTTAAVSRKALRQHCFTDAGRTVIIRWLGTGRRNLDARTGACDWPTTSARSTTGSGADDVALDPVVELGSSGQPLVQLPQSAYTPHFDTLDQAGLRHAEMPGAGSPNPTKSRPRSITASRAEAVVGDGDAGRGSATQTSVASDSLQTHAMRPVKGR